MAVWQCQRLGLVRFKNYELKLGYKENVTELLHGNILGDVKRRPCLISPYHYRLDWLMWFAAFQVRFYFFLPLMSVLCSVIVAIGALANQIRSRTLLNKIWWYLMSILWSHVRILSWNTSQRKINQNGHKVWTTLSVKIESQKGVALHNANKHSCLLFIELPIQSMAGAFSCEVPRQWLECDIINIAQSLWRKGSTKVLQ